MADTNYATKDLANFQVYLKNNAQGMTMMQRASASAKVAIKSVGAAMASMGISWLIGQAISLVAQGLDELAHKMEHTRESAEAITETLSNFNITSAENKAKYRELAETYVELSSGVDELGKNVSLTDEKYKTYLDTVSEIADLNPDIIKSYDAEGRAILSVKDNLDKLNEAYDKKIQKEAKNYIANGDDEGNTISDVIDNFNNYDKRDYFHLNHIDTVSDKAYYDYLSKISTMSREELSKEFSSKQYDTHRPDKDMFAFLKSEEEIAWQAFDFKELYPEDVDYFHTGDDIDSDAYATINEVITSAMENIETQRDADAAGMSEVLSTIAKASDEYIGMTDADIAGLNQVINGLDADIFEKLEIDSKTEATTFTRSIIEAIKENENGFAHAINSMMSFDVSADTVNNTREQIQQYCSIIAKQLNISLADAQRLMGFDDFFATAAKFDKAVAYASGGSYKSAKNVKNSKGYAQADVVNAMNENGINTNAEIDSFNFALQTTESLSDAINNYNIRMQEAAKATLTFEGAWESIGEAKDKLTELAEAGKLTTETFSGVDGAADFLASMGLSEDDIQSVIDKIHELIDSTKPIASLKSGISSIRDAYGEKRDSKLNVVGADTLASMQEEFGNLGKPWEKYKLALGDSNTSLEEARKAQDALATAYVNSNDFLGQLTDGTGKLTKENKQYYVSQLKELGIANALEVVNETYKQQTQDLKTEKEFLKVTGKELTDVTLEELDAFAQEQGYSEDAKDALFQLALQKQLANGTVLDTQSDINALINFVGGLGEATSALESFNTLKNMNAKGKYYLPSDAEEAARENAQKEIDAALDKLKGKKKVGVELDPKIPSEKKSGGKGSGSSKSPQVVDWIARRIDILTQKADYASSRLQNLFSVKARNNNLDKQIRTSTKLINTYGRAADKYEKKLNKIKLSSNLKKKVRNGQISGSLSQLISTYGETRASRISDYQDYYDKSQEAKRNRQEEIAKRRQTRIDKNQEVIDRAEAKISWREQQKENAKTARERNSYLDKEVSQIQKSYTYQIKNAKLNRDTTEAKRLQAELEQRLNDLKIEQHQNTADELQGNLDSLSAQRENLKTANEKNLVIDHEKGITNSLYAEKIAIAQLEGDIYEVQQLQAEQQKELLRLEHEKFTNISADYDNLLSMIQNRTSNIDNQLTIVEAKGIIAGRQYYDNKLSSERENINLMQQELAALESQHSVMERGTEEWYEQESAIQSVKDELASCEQNMVDYRTSIREANKELLEHQKALVDIKSSYLDNVNSYLSRYSMVDEDTANYTDKGLSSLALSRENYINAGTKLGQDQDAMNLVKQILSEINNVDVSARQDILNKYDYSSIEELNERYSELNDAVNSDISEQISAEEEIIALVKEKYEAELSYYQNLISAFKEAQDEIKEMYEYEKQIREKTNTIVDLQKQISSLRRDSSEEARARMQSLQSQLDSAQQDLSDVEYNKYMSDQQSMLDDLYEKFSSMMNDYMLDVDALLAEGNQIAKENKDALSDFANKYAQHFGTVNMDTVGNDVSALASQSERERADQDEANKVMDIISQIGVMDVDGAGRQSLVAAENAYNSLSSGAKQIVDSASVNGLSTIHQKQAEFLNLKSQMEAANAEAEQVNRVAAQNQLIDVVKHTYWQSAHLATKKLNTGDYGEVQKKIYAHGLARDDKPYINAKGVEAVCASLGIAPSASALLKHMNDIGFADGGIASVLKKVPLNNGDDGFITVKKGEGILTPQQTSTFQDMVAKMDPFSNMVASMTNGSGTNTLPPVEKSLQQSNEYNVELNLSLPNVIDADSFIREMKQNSRLKNCISAAALDKVSGRGTLNINRF